MTALLSAACVLAAAALMLTVLMPGMEADADAGQGLYGASLFGDAVGGYVLVALLAAVTAVAVTVVLMRRRTGAGPSQVRRPRGGSDGRP